MLAHLELSGAAFDRGVSQAGVSRRSVAAWVEQQTGALGALGRREAMRAARRGPGLRMQRHLIQEHERLAGIALGAGIAPGLLEWAETQFRVCGRASVCGSELELRLDLPTELLPLMLTRQSQPDAVGFSSVELSALPLSGCVAGVNQHGIAVAIEADRGLDQISLRHFAQDLLFRASDLEGALHHLALRARYAGGSGVLVIASAAGAAFRVELAAGECRPRRLAPRSKPVPESTVRIDSSLRQLCYFDVSDGSERRCELLAIGEPRTAGESAGS